MRTFFALACLLYVLLIPGIASAQRQTSSPSGDANAIEQIRQLRRDTKALAEDVAIVRRDEINYRLDKDLLKTTYSSNLERIKLTITVIFGAVTAIVALLGYLGIRNIKELQDGYSRELSELNTLRTKLEGEIAAITAKQESVEEKVVDLSKTNEEQNRRIRVLELIEKVAELIRTGNYSWALEYLAPALEINPKNEKLLQLKVTAHGRLGEFSTAIATLAQVLEDEPGKAHAVENMAEFLLLSKQIQQFDSHYAKYKAEIDSARDGALTSYLLALRGAINADMVAMKASLTAYLDSCTEPPTARLGPWGFQEFNIFLPSMPDGPAKTLVITVAQFFEGKIPVSELKAALKP